jgi:hypothetical protein
LTLSRICPRSEREIRHFIGHGYPRFIVGERNCPPEHCGGISGFYEMIDVSSDPTHEEHADVCRWPDDYYPEELDSSPIQVALGRIAAKRNAAAKRIIPKKAPSHHAAVLTGWVRNTSGPTRAIIKVSRELRHGYSD